MKKFLSVLLAVLMLATLFVPATFAADEAIAANKCECTEDHYPAESGEKCHCCIWCDNLDLSYRTACVEKTVFVGEDGKTYYDLQTCCVECNGIYPCTCNCTCCPVNSDGSENDSKPIFSEDQQEQIVTTFQRVLKTLREWFDNFFNTIFEFLRFDEIMGA